MQEGCAQEDARLASEAAECSSTKQASVGLEMSTMSSLVPVWITQMTSHRGVAYVTKLLHTREALDPESGQRESAKEYLTFKEKAVLPPVGLDSIKSDPLVAKRKLICQRSGENNGIGEINARLGNVLFDKHVSIRRAAALHDLWCPVSSASGARSVPREPRHADGRQTTLI